LVFLRFPDFLGFELVRIFVGFRGRGRGLWHLDVAVGVDHLATLLAKELLPLDRDGGDFAARAASPRPGSVGVVASPAVDEEATRKHNRGSRALVAPGTVVFTEVLGRTLSGRPLLSARRLFRRLAWHRARQV